MIGRRGRFITLGAAGFFFFTQVTAETAGRVRHPVPQDNLFDAVSRAGSSLPSSTQNGFLAAAFYGPQSRVMDGVLARANCLLISTLWTAFKFIMVPIGGQLARYSPRPFASSSR